MIIENLGTGERCAEAMRLLLSAEDKKLLPKEIKRAVLLPIPTSKDKIHLTGTDKLICEIFDSVEKGDLICGYGIDEKAKASMKERGVLVYDALEDETFLAENARHTAMGAVGYLLSTSKSSPEDVRFSIVGYGRIGSALLRILLFLGARVRVFSSKEKTCVSLGECGVDTRYTEACAPISIEDTDVIINTAPKDLSSSFPQKRVPSELRVIELASGENFKGIEGIERLPGVPDKYYPKSAGRAYFDRIFSYMKGVTK